MTRIIGEQTPIALIGYNMSKIIQSNLPKKKAVILDSITGRYGARREGDVIEDTEERIDEYIALGYAKPYSEEVSFITPKRKRINVSTIQADKVSNERIVA